LEQARRIAVAGEAGPPVDEPGDTIAQLSRELLPEWLDEWLLMDRERWDQFRLRALETLARRLLTDGHHFLALDAALAAVEIEPVRESAHRTVVEVYLACALKHYRRYSQLVMRELGVTPSARMTKLINAVAS
jgi:DNA-binding SARP family transcriptional activator